MIFWICGDRYVRFCQILNFREIQHQGQLDGLVIDYSENPTTDRPQMLHRSVLCGIWSTYP